MLAINPYSLTTGTYIYALWHWVLERLGEGSGGEEGEGGG